MNDLATHSPQHTQGGPTTKPGGTHGNGPQKTKKALIGKDLETQLKELSPEPEPEPMPGPNQDLEAGPGPGDELEDTDPTEEVPESSIEETESLVIEAAYAQILGKKWKPANKKRGKKWRRNNRVGSVLGFLAPHSAAHITTIASSIAAQDPAIFEKIVLELARSGSAATHPREAKAFLAAVGDAAMLERGAEAALAAKQDLALKLFADAMTAEGRKAFLEKNEAAKAAVETPSAEVAYALDPKRLAAEDEAKAKADLERRQRMAKAQKDEKAKTEAAKEKTDAARPIAQQVLEDLKASAHAAAVDRLGAIGDPALFTQVVRELDATNAITTLFERMSLAEKWNDRPALCGRILAARSPERNIADARALLGFEVLSKPKKAKAQSKLDARLEARDDKLDGYLTPERAYAAFQLLKALPPAHRERFEQAYPGLVVKLNTSLNASMREAEDTNFFGTGEGDAETLTKLVVKVRDEELWRNGRPGELESTIKLLLKGGRRQEVVDQVEQLRGAGVLDALLAGDPERARVVNWAVSLAASPQLDTKGDTKNHANAYTGKGGVLKAIGNANKETRQELKAAKKRGEKVDEKLGKYTLLNQALKRKEGVELKNARLDELQQVVDAFTYGGDVEFAKNSGKPDDETNKVDLKFDQNQGQMEFRAPMLALERLRYPMGGMTVESGKTTMEGLYLRVTWPTNQNPGQKRTVHVTADALAIGDVFLTQPGSVIGIGHIGAKGLTFDLEEASVDFGKDGPDQNKILQSLGQHNPSRTLLAAIAQSAGASKGLNKSEGNAAEDFTTSLGNLTATLTGLPPTALGGYGVDLKSLDIRDISLGADTYVGKVAAEGLALHSDSRPSVMGQKRLEQLRAQDEAARKEQEATPAPGEKRSGQLADNRKRYADEIRELEGKMTSWKELESLQVYTLEVLARVGGAGGKTDGEKAAVADVKARAAALKIEGAEGMDLPTLAKAIKDRLAVPVDKVVTAQSVSVEAVKTDGMEVGNVDAKDLSLATHATANGSETKVHAESLSVKGAAQRSRVDIPSLIELRQRHDTWRAIVDPSTLPALEQNQRTALLEQFAAKIEGVSFGTHVSALLDFVTSLGGPSKVDAAVATDPALLEKLQRLERPLAAAPMTLETLEAKKLDASLTSTSNSEGNTSTSKTALRANAQSLDAKGNLGIALDAQGKAADITYDGTSTATKSGKGDDATTTTTTTHDGKLGFDQLRMKDSPVGTIGAKDAEARFNVAQTTTESGGQSRSEITSLDAGLTTGKTSLVSGGNTVDANSLAVTVKGGKDQPTKVTANAKGIEGGTDKVDLHGKKIGVEELGFEADLPEMQKLMQGDLSGPIPVRNIVAGPVTLPQVTWNGAGMSVSMASGNIDRMTADATVTLEHKVGAGLTVKSLEVGQLTVPCLSAQGIVVKVPIEGELVEIGLPSAELDTLSLKGLKLDGFDTKSLMNASGRFDLASLRVDLSEKLPYGLKAGGYVKVDGLYANAMKDGGDVQFGFADLNLRSLGLDRKALQDSDKMPPLAKSILAKGGSIKQRGKLSAAGNYNRKTGLLTATTKLGDVSLSNIHYADGASKLDLDSADLKGIEVSAHTTVGADGIGQVKLDRLFVRQLTGTNIGYHGETEVKDTWPDGSERIKKSTSDVSFKKGTLRELELKGLKKGYSLDLTRADVEGLDVLMQQDGDDVLQANLNAQVDKLAIKMIEKDLALSMDHGYLEGTVDLGDRGRDGTTTHVGFTGIGVDKVKAGITDMGGDNQAIVVTTALAEAYNLHFADGLAWNGNGRIDAFGQAELHDLTWYKGKEGMALKVGRGKASIPEHYYRTEGFMKGKDPEDKTPKSEEKKPELPPVVLDPTGKNYGYTWNAGKDYKPQTVVNTEPYATKGGGVAPSPMSKDADVQWKLDLLRDLNGHLELTHPDAGVMAKVLFKQGKTAVDLGANARESTFLGKAWNSVVVQGIVDWGKWIEFNVPKMIEDGLNKESTMPKDDPGPRRFETLGRILTNLYPTIMKSLWDQSFWLSTADGLAGVDLNDLWQWQDPNEVRRIEEETRRQGLPPSVAKERIYNVTFAQNFLRSTFDGDLRANGKVIATDKGQPMLDAHAGLHVTLGGSLQQGLTSGVDAWSSGISFTSGKTKASVGFMKTNTQNTTTLSQTWADDRSELTDARLENRGSFGIEFYSLEFQVGSDDGGDPKAASAAAEERLKGGGVDARKAKAEKITRVGK